MNTRKTFAIPFVVFALGTASAAWATKPTVQISEMMPRATHIVVATVVSEALVSPTKRAENGDWLPERRLVRAQLRQVLKTDNEHKVQKAFDFKAEGLVFEKGESYIFFLKVVATAATHDKKPVKSVRFKSVRFEHLGSPARRVEATRATIKEVKDELKKNVPANKPDAGGGK